MPYVSKAQMRWAFATKQSFAKEWADKTKDPSKLPEHKKPGKTFLSKT